MIKICFRYAGDIDGAGIIFNNAMLHVFRNIRIEINAAGLNSLAYEDFTPTEFKEELSKFDE